MTHSTVCLTYLTHCTSTLVSVTGYIGGRMPRIDYVFLLGCVGCASRARGDGL